MLELEQAPVDPVHQHSTSESTVTGLQPSYPPTGLAQPLGSAVEVVLPLETSITAGPSTSQFAPARPTGADEPPTFTLGLQNQTVTTGDAAVFTVFFSGQPRPTVEWYINGRLVDGGRTDVEIVEDIRRGTSTLTVLSSSVDNEAQYACRVHNTRGTAFTNAHLFVLGKQLQLIILNFMRYRIQKSLQCRKGA